VAEERVSELRRPIRLILSYNVDRVNAILVFINIVNKARFRRHVSQLNQVELSDDTRGGVRGAIVVNTDFFALTTDELCVVELVGAQEASLARLDLHAARVAHSVESDDRLQLRQVLPRRVFRDHRH